MSTPSIKVYDSASHHGHYQLPHRTAGFAPASASPMGIPNVREPPPPPLPPPRHIQDLKDGQDTGWILANNHASPAYGGTPNGQVKPGSSLLGGAYGSQGSRENGERGHNGTEPSFGRRAVPPPRPINTNLFPERRASVQEEGTTMAKPALGSISERQLGQKTLEHSSQRYDQQLLSKIGGPNTPSRVLGPPFFSASSQESSRSHRGSVGHLNGQLKPLSVPERRYNSIDSPGSRRPSAPSSGTISPGFNGFRSPVFDHTPSDRVRRFGSISGPSAFEDSVPVANHSHRGSYDQSFPMDPDFAADESGMRDLNLNDRSPAGSDDYQQTSRSGQKRRASSPPAEAAREDRPAGSGSNDLYHRRSAQRLGSVNSPVSRFNANHGSVSTTPSSFGQRTNSYGSSYGLSVASSVTSYASERLSPGALSPTVDAEYGPVSTYAASKSLNPSPRGSVSTSVAAHHPRADEIAPTRARKMSAENVPHARQNVIPRIPGLFFCDCCPKKPRKFETEEQLREHEQEKQYGCTYCQKRFKNKNEAERHQNSLHLRRHSWSCAALADMRDAFHSSSSHPATRDVCGFCGDEFDASPADWDARADHLNHVHKFGECNQAKKFFRADHFRQHLKHSHAGASGKWTNMLENACMKYETPPSPPASQSSQQSPGAAGAAGGKERVGSVGSLRSGPTPGASKHEVIDEEHDEC